MAELVTEWDLERYFYSSIDDENLKKDLETYKSRSDVFIEKYKQNIANLSDEDFLGFLEEMDTLNVEIEKVLIYLSFVSSLDTQNQDVQKETARIHKMISEYNEKFLFIDEEFKLIGWKKFEYYTYVEILAPFKNYLRTTGISLQYLLSQPEEKVVIKLSTAYGSNLYEELVSSFEFNFRGEKISEDEVRTLREDQDRNKRLDAFKALACVYLNKQNQIVLGNLYCSVCKDNVSDVELRKYQTVMSQRNISEELQDKTVDTLLDNVSNNYILYQKFLFKKAQILELDKLETHDIYAPFPVVEDIEGMPFEEGWELYKKTVEKIDPELAAFSDEMLNNGRISVYPKQGKTSGAYANYTKNLPEFVLLNWANSPGDVATLAHEMGHAFHGFLSKKQKGLVYGTPLTLAETASIFNETLMFETLLEITESKAERNKLICSRLDDIFGTIFRQVMYVRFERRCHESFQRNEPLTFDDYNRIWIEESKKLVGPDVNLDENLIKHGWSAISHIFQSPFYCYTYAFGNIISLNLYQNYKNSSDKEKFLNKYHDFLAAGGSDTPENLLNNIFDMKFDDNFYNTAFYNIDELINKLD
jgi:oligoendopeptidase F